MPNRRSRHLRPVALLSALLLAGCNQQAAAPDDSIVLAPGSSPIVEPTSPGLVVPVSGVSPAEFGFAAPIARFRGVRSKSQAPAEGARRPAVESYIASVPLLTPYGVPPAAPTSSQLVSGADPIKRLPAPKPLGRTAAMAAVARAADAHNRRGYELANRGALFSARAEFLQSLRLLAEGLDAETHSNEYARSLAAGLRALDEADDFSQRSTRLDRELSLAALIRAHSTTVLKGQPLDALTPPEAIAQYHEFAAEHLAASVGGETAGSLALHALGKAQAEFTRLKTSSVVDPQLKLLVFERAALLVDPNNYLASNDLGVALADRGELVEARNLLARAARLCPQPQIWHNLSVIHARLGESLLAESADSMAMQASGGTNPANLAALQSVRWVDQAAFHQLSPPPTDLNPAPPIDATKPVGPQQPPRRAMPAWLQWGSKQP